MNPENMALQGRRKLSASTHPEITAKLQSERGKILKRLLRGVRQFQKQNPCPNISPRPLAGAGAIMNVIGKTYRYRVALEREIKESRIVSVHTVSAFGKTSTVMVLENGDEIIDPSPYGLRD